jgi:DNA-binding MarR family transcriptional regulator
VNSGQLLQLGRKLLEIAKDELMDEGDAALSVGEMAVIADVLYHPGSTVAEITARTGLAQSRVSTAISSLRTLGAVETRPDTSDRRRTLVLPGERVRAALDERVGRPVEAALRRRLGDLPQDRAAELLEAISELHELLVVNAWGEDLFRPATTPGEVNT